MALLQTVYDSPLFYKGFGVGVLLLFLYLGKVHGISPVYGSISELTLVSSIHTVYGSILCRDFQDLQWLAPRRCG